ncbi:MAG: M23 family metallopeptidase [Candidatus Zixiibacteriota bacterium]
MRVKERLQLMIIPPSTDGVRQFSLHPWVIPGALGSIAVLVLVALTTSIFAFKYWTSDSELARQKEANRQLQLQIAQLDRSVGELHDKLVLLEESEQQVRSVFGFPELDPAERALGIGGNVIPDEMLAGGSDDGPFDAVFAIETDLDRLLRRAEFERENFEAIYKALIDRKEQLDHTPSISPVDGHLVRGYGIRPDPFTGVKRLHGGVDLSANIGTPVRAPANGRVTATGYQSQLGKMIKIDHGYNVETRYGHLSKILVKRGQTVKRGEVIGYAGNTGYSTGPHLHYEVHVDGRRVDPLKYIYDFTPWTSEPLAQNDN